MAAPPPSPTHVPLPVFPTPPRLTPSGVADLACPRKFKRLRIDRDWPNEGVPLPVSHGRAVHAVLRDLYAARNGPDLPTHTLEARARAAVWAAWYPKGTDRELQAQRVRAAAAAFAAADDEEDIAGVLDLERAGAFEVRVAESAPGRGDGGLLCLISAVLDCVLVRAGEPDRLVVRERKTTAQRVDLREAYILMRVARKMHPQYKNVAVEYDWLDAEGRVARETVEGRDVRGQHALVLGSAYRVLTAGRYPATPGEAVCRFCPERSTCEGLPGDELSRGALERLAALADAAAAWP